MTTLDYIEKIDNTLAHWEDYFHGEEGSDVTEARANLDKVRKQLILFGVVVPKGTLSCGCKDHLTVTFTSEGDYCGNCGKIIPTT